jgi:8-oxo-dGTP diphosphatase
MFWRPVDKSAFRTRMLSAYFLEEAGYVAAESNRPATEHRLRDRSARATAFATGHADRSRSP